MNLSILTRLLAAATFFSLLQSLRAHPTNELYNYTRHFVLLGSAAGFLFAEKAVVRWALVALISLDFFVLLPEAPNHRHLLFFLNLVYAICLLDPERLKEKTLPAIRLIACLVYFFAFFAKLNLDYISSSSSCSIEFYKNITILVPFLPSSEAIAPLAIWGSLLVEAALPILLVARPLWGIVLGFSFHVFLGLDLIKYFINFSSVMFVCLAAFFPYGSLGEAAKANRKWLQPLFPMGVALGLIVLAWSTVIYLSPPAELKRLVQEQNVFALMRLRLVFWGVYVLALSLVGFTALKYLWKESVSWKPAMRTGMAECVVIALVTINGLSPYIGLKTRTSFNMYSNMYMSHKDSNHLVVPRSLDAFSYLENLENGQEPDNPIARKLLNFRVPKRNPGGKCVW